MPNLKEHLKLESDLLGSRTPEIHKLIDWDSKILQSRHRPTTHQDNFLLFIEKRYGRKAALIGFLHILQDYKLI